MCNSFLGRPFWNVRSLNKCLFSLKSILFNWLFDFSGLILTFYQILFLLFPIFMIFRIKLFILENLLFARSLNFLLMVWIKVELYLLLILRNIVPFILFTQTLSQILPQMKAFFDRILIWTFTFIFYVYIFLIYLLSNNEILFLLCHPFTKRYLWFELRLERRICRFHYSFERLILELLLWRSHSIVNRENL